MVKAYLKHGYGIVKAYLMYGNCMVKAYLLYGWCIAEATLTDRNSIHELFVSSIPEQASMFLIPVPSIDSFNLVLGKNPGELLASAKSSGAADMHMYQIAPAPLAGPRDFETHYRRASKLLLTGLLPMKLYAVRIGAIASDGEVVCTDTLTKAPQ